MKHVKAGHVRPVVCLDAGHNGKYNRSPAVSEYYESEMNWKLHLLLQQELTAYNIEVQKTRSSLEQELGVYQRGTASQGCDLLLSVHSNAVGSQVDETVDRVMVYVPLDGSGDEIGQMFVDRISQVMGTSQKGRIATREGNSGNYYGIIRGAADVGTTGLILEHSFHTNTRSTLWLMEEANLVRLAKAEAALLAEYFEIAETVPVPSPNTPPTGNPSDEDILYRVQTGAYRVKENAQAQLDRILDAGFDAYITSRPKE